MARMYRAQRQAFPRTVAWLRQMRTTIPNRDGGRIWRAFVEYGQFSEQEALRACPGDGTLSSESRDLAHRRSDCLFGVLPLPS
jgi:hypothetical protein